MGQFSLQGLHWLKPQQVRKSLPKSWVVLMSTLRNLVLLTILLKMNQRH